MAANTSRGEPVVQGEPVIYINTRGELVSRVSREQALAILGPIVRALEEEEINTSVGKAWTRFEEAVAPPPIDWKRVEAAEQDKL